MEWPGGPGVPTETPHEPEGSYRRLPMHARRLVALFACRPGQTEPTPSEWARAQGPCDSVRCGRMGSDTTLGSRA